MVGSLSPCTHHLDVACLDPPNTPNKRERYTRIRDKTQFLWLQTEGLSMYPLVICCKAIENGPVETVFVLHCFPIKAVDLKP